jgi:hypothetical protein
MSHKLGDGDSDGEDDSGDVGRLGESKEESKYDSKEETKQEKLSDEELLKRVQDFFYCNDELADHFESFINRRSSVVNLTSDEYKLEYTAVFNEYKQLFERKMEDFIINDLKSSVQDFYFALKAKTDAPEDSSESVFAQILVAVTDFDIFMTMMREAAQSNQEQMAAGSDHK